MLYLAIDGTGVPMIPAETEGRAGEGEDGRARTREAKLCCAFTQTTVDDEGRRVRDPRSSSYLATFALAAEFGKLMAAEARRRGAGHIRQLVILGDGAAWIWNLAANHFPEATQIVDLYHAREHLHDLASSWSSCSPATGRTGWANGSPSSTPATFPRSAPPPAPSPLTGRKAQELATARGYFEHNAHRMHYARFKKLGMFAGSGAVEAGFEAVIGQRLKLSSMKWSQARAADVMTLRCLQASDRWEQIRAEPGQTPAA
jgi:hypothetical protein